MFLHICLLSTVTPQKPANDQTRTRPPSQPLYRPPSRARTELLHNPAAMHTQRMGTTYWIEAMNRLDQSLLSLASPDGNVLLVVLLDASQDCG